MVSFQYVSCSELDYKFPNTENTSLFVCCLSLIPQCIIMYSDSWN